AFGVELIQHLHQLRTIGARRVIVEKVELRYALTEEVSPVSSVHHQCCLMLFVREYLCSPHHIRLVR
ncbi:TPA: hypothetical protein M0F49_003716, partial [Salmonella enterica subsp. enterica serovar Cotham]|nr:hypothetical protein [Salmonella enterica subsp. enterica serovar Cotham]